MIPFMIMKKPGANGVRNLLVWYELAVNSRSAICICPENFLTFWGSLKAHCENPNKCWMLIFHTGHFVFSSDVWSTSCGVFTSRNNGGSSGANSYPQNSHGLVLEALIVPLKLLASLSWRKKVPQPPLSLKWALTIKTGFVPSPTDFHYVDSEQLMEWMFGTQCIHLLPQKLT